jgi:DNA-binding transcriptional ArsR family regulator
MTTATANAEGEFLDDLWVAPASQWLSTTCGRIAPDGYSWMQAVHWVAGSGLYDPRRHRSHGPRSFGLTTVRVAHELVQVSPCRPGIEHLMRRTGLSERTVEYHLSMLRETGLLTYVVRGTRIRGQAAQASEFALTIPLEFDQALGIRTTVRDKGAPAYSRAATGIAIRGRKLMAKLAKKAAWKVSKHPSQASTRRARAGVGGASGSAISAASRCTPMGGRSSTRATAGTTSSPPESRLASRQSKSPIPKKEHGGRKRNCVGRRFQLASTLIRQVPWMGRASVPRIAWIVREVSDAGWSADEVIAFLDCGNTPTRVHRPSGFLAGRLTGAVALWPTAEGRARAVQAYRDSRRAEQARHQEWEGTWEAPKSLAVRRMVSKAVTARPQQYTHGEALPGLDNIENLSPNDLADMRTTARGEFMSGDTALITSALDILGLAAAVHIYGSDLVHRARKLASSSSLMTVGRQ